MARYIPWVSLVAANSTDTDRSAATRKPAARETPLPRNVALAAMHRGFLAVQQLDPRHRLQRHSAASARRLRVVRLDCSQRSLSRNDGIHLAEKLFLACALAGLQQARIGQAWLLHRFRLRFHGSDAEIFAGTADLSEIP